MAPILVEFDRPLPPSGLEYQLGLMNDNRVRIRTQPNLTSSEVLGHRNKGDLLRIIGQTEEPMKIGNMNSVWYKILYGPDNREAWIYGHFVDVMEPLF